MIFPIDPVSIPSVWHLASPQLNRAFEQSESDTASNHLFGLMHDNEQLWSIRSQAWAITRVILGKSGDRVLEIVALAGAGVDEWGPEFFAVVESWARANGCKRSVFTGRIGWKKHAPGYTAKRITFLKEL